MKAIFSKTIYVKYGYTGRVEIFPKLKKTNPNNYYEAMDPITN